MSIARGKVRSIRPEESITLGPNIQARMTSGKAPRETVPRKSHAAWIAVAGRPDPVDLLQRSDHGRLLELLPIRYGRMQQSPFAFFRGSAEVMAWDLSRTPTTGIQVQACGDCHAGNFGGLPVPSGSVGTRCAVALLMAGEHDPMLLQFKEALPSVLEPYAGKSRYANHGERVVIGQRMLQSASDVFLVGRAIRKAAAITSASSAT